MLAGGGVVAGDGAVVTLHDVQVLDHVGQALRRVVVADAAGYAAGLAERVVQLEAHDAEDALAARVRTAPVAGDAEGLTAVEVVAVDDGEGLLDHAGGHQHGVGGAPGLLALGVDRQETGGDLVQLLGHEDKLQGASVGALDVAVFARDRLLELLEEVFADDVNHFAETGLYGVVNGIIDNGFAVGAEAVHLLESAVTATHAGGEDEKCRFHVEFGFIYFPQK